MSNKTIDIYLLPKQSVLESAAKDLITFSFLCLCIYVSQGSTWWTFFTAVCFLLLCAVKLKRMLETHSTEFTDKDKAIEYIKSISLNE